MLTEPTFQKLNALKLFGMVEGLKEQIQSTEITSLSFEERLALLVDRQWNWKEDRALKNRIKKASFKIQACMEDIDYQTHRGLNRSVMAQLALSNWIDQAQNCTLTGPTGIGKTFISCAIGNKACRNGFAVLSFTTKKLFRELALATEQGKASLFFRNLAKTSLLIIDDWGMDSLDDSQYRDFLEIIDDRYQNGATLITSQVPVEHWHDGIGNPTLADAILDRIIHNAHSIQLDGDSMRKQKTPKKNTKQNSKKKRR